VIFQKTPSKCGCLLCNVGCLCGDCSSCTNPVAEKIFLRNVKSVSILCCVVLVVGGFLFFAPVMSLGSEVPLTTGVFSIKIQTSEASTAELCSITFCYLGQGAVYSKGVYYPLTKYDSGLCQVVSLRGDGGKRTQTCVQSRVRDASAPYLPLASDR